MSPDPIFGLHLLKILSKQPTNMMRDSGVLSGVLGPVLILRCPNDSQNTSYSLMWKGPKFPRVSRMHSKKSDVLHV